MHFLDYQVAAKRTAKYNHKSYPFLALSEEVGEVMGKLAKHVRKYDKQVDIVLHNANYPIFDEEKKLRADLVSELGDVLWQLTMCCHEIGTSLEHVAEENIRKLMLRDANGTIIGEGDNR